MTDGASPLESIGRLASLAISLGLVGTQEFLVLPKSPPAAAPARDLEVRDDLGGGFFQHQLVRPERLAKRDKRPLKDRLETVLRDALMSHLFLWFQASQFCPEAALFVMQVFEFERNFDDGPWAQNAAFDLVRGYVMVDAPLEINLTTSTRDDIVTKMRENQLTRDTFASAVEGCITTMATNMGSFWTAPIYKLTCAHWKVVARLVLARGKLTLPTAGQVGEAGVEDEEEDEEQGDADVERGCFSWRATPRTEGEDEEQEGDEDDGDSTWYVWDGDEEAGPFSMDELLLLWKFHVLYGDAHIRKTTQPPHWRQPSELSIFQDTKQLSDPRDLLKRS